MSLSNLNKQTIATRIICILLVITFLALDVSFAFEGADRNCLAPAPGSQDPALKQYWAFVDISLLIGRILHLGREQRLYHPIEILRPLIDARLAHPGAQFSLAGTCIISDSLKEVREGEALTGLSLDVRHNGTRHTLIYTLDPQPDAAWFALDENGDRVFVRPLSPPRPLEHVIPDAEKPLPPHHEPPAEDPALATPSTTPDTARQSVGPAEPVPATGRREALLNIMCGMGIVSAIVLVRAGKDLVRRGTEREARRTMGDAKIPAYPETIPPERSLAERVKALDADSLAASCTFYFGPDDRLRDAVIRRGAYHENHSWDDSIKIDTGIVLSIKKIAELIEAALGGEEPIPISFISTVPDRYAGLPAVLNEKISAVIRSPEAKSIYERMAAAASLREKLGVFLEFYYDFVRFNEYRDESEYAWLGDVAGDLMHEYPALRDLIATMKSCGAAHRSIKPMDVDAVAGARQTLLTINRDLLVPNGYYLSPAFLKSFILDRVSDFMFRVSDVFRLQGHVVLSLRSLSGMTRRFNVAGLVEYAHGNHESFGAFVVNHQCADVEREFLDAVNGLRPYRESVDFDDKVDEEFQRQMTLLYVEACEADETLREEGMVRSHDEFSTVLHEMTHTFTTDDTSRYRRLGGDYGERVSNLVEFAYGNPRIVARLKLQNMFIEGKDNPVEDEDVVGDIVGLPVYNLRERDTARYFTIFETFRRMTDEDVRRRARDLLREYAPDIYSLFESAEGRRFREEALLRIMERNVRSAVRASHAFTAPSRSSLTGKASAWLFNALVAAVIGGIRGIGDEPGGREDISRREFLTGRAPQPSGDSEQFIERFRSIAPEVIQRMMTVSVRAQLIARHGDIPEPVRKLCNETERACDQIMHAHYTPAFIHDSGRREQEAYLRRSAERLLDLLTEKYIAAFDDEIYREGLTEPGTRIDDIMKRFNRSCREARLLLGRMLERPAIVREESSRLEAIERAGIAVRRVRHNEGIVFTNIPNLRQALYYALEHVAESPHSTVKLLEMPLEDFCNDLDRFYTDIVKRYGNASKEGTMTLEEAREIVGEISRHAATAEALLRETQAVGNAVEGLAAARWYEDLLKTLRRSRNIFSSCHEIAIGGKKNELTDVNKIARELEEVNDCLTVVNNLARDIRIPGNHLSIKSALYNIIHNGAYYAKKQAQDDPSWTGDPNVTMRLDEDGDWIRIEITNNGEAIGEKNLLIDPLTGRRRIFTLNASERKGGTGLGDTEAWIVVTDLGGSLTVENTADGPRFVIRLQRRKASEVSEIFRDHDNLPGISPDTALRLNEFLEPYAAALLIEIGAMVERLPADRDAVFRELIEILIDASENDRQAEDPNLRRLRTRLAAHYDARLKEMQEPAGQTPRVRTRVDSAQPKDTIPESVARVAVTEHGGDLGSFNDFAEAAGFTPNEMRIATDRYLLVEAARVLTLVSAPDPRADVLAEARDFTRLVSRLDIPLGSRELDAASRQIRAAIQRVGEARENAELQSRFPREAVEAALRSERGDLFETCRSLGGLSVATLESLIEAYDLSATVARIHEAVEGEQAAKERDGRIAAVKDLMALLREPRRSYPPDALVPLMPRSETLAARLAEAEVDQDAFRELFLSYGERYDALYPADDPPKGAPGTLLRYMYENGVFVDRRPGELGPQFQKEMAGKRGGNDSSSTISLEVHYLRQMDLIEGGQRARIALPAWFRRLDKARFEELLTSLEALSEDNAAPNEMELLVAKERIRSLRRQLAPEEAPGPVENGKVLRPTYLAALHNNAVVPTLEEMLFKMQVEAECSIRILLNHPPLNEFGLSQQLARLNARVTGALTREKTETLRSDVERAVLNEYEDLVQTVIEMHNYLNERQARIGKLFDYKYGTLQYIESIKSRLWAHRAEIVDRYAGPLRTAFGPERADAVMQAVHEQYDRMDALLGFSSRFLRGVSAPSRGDLDGIIRETVARVAKEAGAGKSVIVTTPRDERLADVPFDALYIQFITAELVKNALKERSVTTVRVSYAYEPSTNRAMLTVSDDGEGIKDALLERAASCERQELFKYAVTSAGSGKTGRLGTGLGLAFLYELMDRLKGSLEAANAPAPAGGAIFSAWFPLHDIAFASISDHHVVSMQPADKTAAWASGANGEISLTIHAPPDLPAVAHNPQQIKARIHYHDRSYGTDRQSNPIWMVVDMKRMPDTTPGQHRFAIQAADFEGEYTFMYSIDGGLSWLATAPFGDNRTIARRHAEAGLTDETERARVHTLRDVITALRSFFKIDEPVILAIGRNWMRDYDETNTFYRPLNMLMVRLRAWLEGKGIALVDAPDDKLLDAINARREEKRWRHARVIALASLPASALDNNTGHTGMPAALADIKAAYHDAFVIGIDDAHLEPGRHYYTRIPQILAMALRLAFDVPCDPDPNIAVDSERYPFPVLIPRAEPISQEDIERFKQFYIVQASA